MMDRRLALELKLQSRLLSSKTNRLLMPIIKVSVVFPPVLNRHESVTWAVGGFRAIIVIESAVRII